MLVLSRQRDETIMIGDDIAITIVDIRGDKVRLGITAPTKIAVHRKEVYEAIKAENQRAATIAPPHSGDIAAIQAAVAPRLAGGNGLAKAHRLSVNGHAPGGPMPFAGGASPAPNHVRPTGTDPLPPQSRGPHSRG